MFPAALVRHPETGASRVNLSGNFELLGAAIGSKAHCEAMLLEKFASLFAPAA